MPIKLKPIIALATFSASLAFSASAWASDWVLVGADIHRSLTYIDKSSISVNGNIRTFWTRVDHSHNKTVISYENLQQYDLDCQNKTYNIIYDIERYHNKEQKQQNFYSLRNTTEYPIPPDSIVESVADVVCAH